MILYCCDFQNLGKLHQEGTWQVTGLETHTWEMALCTKEDPRGTAAHQGTTPGRGTVGGMDEQRKTVVHRPQPPVSPVTSPKGWGVQRVVKIREVGTKKVEEKCCTETEPGEAREKTFPSVFVLSHGILFSPSIAKSVIKSLCCQWIKRN